MRLTITGTSSKGAPVSLLVDFPDESSARAYADWKGIAVDSIALAPKSLNDAQLDAASPMVSPQQRLRSTAGALYVWAWITLVVGLASLFIPFPIACLLLPTSFLLFIMGAIYGSNARVAEAVAENNQNA